ncbi:MAG TPA: hypothetical protein VH209_16930, partial [Steroidobacteraceae bacterium]|nr:hypothetical protein [Steroidobacteraceae bacterium]
VLGSTRLRLPALRAPAPREAELVQATGGFLARVVTPSAGALGLFEHFFRRVRERAPLGRGRDGNGPQALGGGSGDPPTGVAGGAAVGRPEVRSMPGRGMGSPPWEFLEHHCNVTPAELHQLRGWYADARAGRRVPLDRLHNLIQKIHRHTTA